MLNVRASMSNRTQAEWKLASAFFVVDFARMWRHTYIGNAMRIDANVGELKWKSSARRFGINCERVSKLDAYGMQCNATELR
jgi:hypothetical protein